MSIDISNYSDDYVFPILCGSGLMDFEITNGDDVHWYLQDDSESSDSRPSQNLGVGTNYLFATNITDNDIEINDNNTNENYTGSLEDMPKIGYLLSLRSTQSSGTLYPSETLKDINVQETSMTADDTDNIIINLADITTENNGTLKIKDNRTTTSDTAYTYLTTTKSWTITEGLDYLQDSNLDDLTDSLGNELTA